MFESAEEFLALRTSTNPDAYTRAANEPAPNTVWREVITKYPEMRKRVVHDKTVPMSILEELAGDDDPNVRHAVAGKRKATPGLLRKLAEDVDAGVRLAVAMNRSTPRAILEGLLADPWKRVAEAARGRLARKAANSDRRDGGRG